MTGNHDIFPVLNRPDEFRQTIFRFSDGYIHLTPIIAIIYGHSFWRTDLFKPCFVPAWGMPNHGWVNTAKLRKVSGRCLKQSGIRSRSAEGCSAQLEA